MRAFPHPVRPGARPARGFTLIELIVVLALVGALLAIAAPRYVDVLDRGRERAQQANLQVLRGAIDAFHGDQGRYPDSLAELVDRRYLRRLPVDPVSESADWQVVPPPDGLPGRVWDVRPAVVAARPAPDTAPAAPGADEAAR